jgi:signal transduction histidine kinase
MLLNRNDFFILNTQCPPASSAMKRYILLLIALYPFIGYNQTAEESLLSQLQYINEKDHDSIYYELYKMHQDTDPEKSVKYAFKHLDHSLKFNDFKGMAKSYRIIGTSLLNMNEFDSAKYYLEKGYEIADSIYFIDELIKNCGQLGAVNIHFDDYKKSVEFYLRFLELSKDEDIPHYIAIGYNNLGLIYYRIGDYNTSLKFYLMCIETKRNYNITDGILFNYYNIGLCYTGIQNYNEAINYFNLVIDNCEKCETNNLIDAYYGLGKAHTKMKKYNEALYYLNKSSTMASSNSNYLSYANSNTLIAEIYVHKKDLKKALIYLNRIKEKDFKYPFSIDYKIMLLYSDIYEKIGDYQKALNYKNKYIYLKDSVFSDQKVSEVKNLLIDYQLSESEEIIKGKNIQIQRNRQFVYMFGISLLLLSVVLFFAYRNIKFRKRLNEKLSSLVYERTQDLNAFLYRTSHDLAGPVATIKGLLRLMSIDNYQNEMNNFINRIDLTNQRLESIITKLNKVSKINSKTIEYEDVNIESLIAEIINDVKNGSDNLINIDRTGDSIFRTDKTLIHTIFYNILLNSFQHMDHREILHEVKVDIKNNENLLVEISDNGKGIEVKYIRKIFDLFYVANDKPDGNGLGLYQAKLAAQRLKGDITLLNNKKPVIFQVSIRQSGRKLININ